MSYTVNGTYKFVCSSDNRVLDVPYSKIEHGTRVGTYPWHGGNNQRWIAKPEAKGFTLTTALHGETALDESEVDAGQVILWAHHGRDNQLWIAIPVPGNEHYAFIKNVQTGRCLRSEGDGPTCCVAKCASDMNMWWSILAV